jgi:hypothetical protein
MSVTKKSNFAPIVRSQRTVVMETSMKEKNVTMDCRIPTIGLMPVEVVAYYRSVETVSAIPVRSVTGRLVQGGEIQTAHSIAKSLDAVTEW